MALSHPTLSRLQSGRPVLLGSDPAASFRARGVELRGPASLGRLLREHPAVVREHYQQEIEAGVDVIACLTADTLPRALQQIGMPFRAAALTGDAVELAIEVADLASRPIVVAGVLGNLEVPPLTAERLVEELDLHAARLKTAGCEIVLARGLGAATSHEAGRNAAIASAARTALAVWAVALLDREGDHGGVATAADVARRSMSAGAEMVIFEVPDADTGVAVLDHLRAHEVDHPDHTGSIGVALAAGSLQPSEWASEAARLIDHGATALGGGRGATTRHLAALATRLGGGKRQSIWPRAV